MSGKAPCLSFAMSSCVCTSSNLSVVSSFASTVVSLARLCERARLAFSHEDVCFVVQLLQMQALTPGERPVHGDEEHTEDEYGLQDRLPEAFGQKIGPLYRYSRKIKKQYVRRSYREEVSARIPRWLKVGRKSWGLFVQTFSDDKFADRSLGSCLFAHFFLFLGTVLCFNEFVILPAIAF